MKINFNVHFVFALKKRGGVTIPIMLTSIFVGAAWCLILLISFKTKAYPLILEFWSNTNNIGVDEIGIITNPPPPNLQGSNFQVKI